MCYATPMQDVLRRELEILNKIEPRFGSSAQAREWYESEPLSGFGGNTAMQLVHDGRADEVLAYFEAVDVGIHA